MIRTSLFAIVLLSSTPLLAQTNAPLAEALFREASEAFKAGRVAEACTKFAESQKLDPQRGTLANLARCHEREGKLATAWSDYTALRDLARQANDEPRITYAQKKIDELEPQLAKLQLSVENGTQVKEMTIDGTSVGAAAIGTTFPVDSGKHDVEVTSTDGRKWHQSVDVQEKGTTSLLLKMPPPEPPKVDPKPIVENPPPPQTTNDRPWQRPLAIGVGAAGAVGVVIGSVLGVLVVVKKSDVDKNCIGKSCNALGFAAQNEAWGLSTGATIALIAGGVLLAGGVVLWVTAPKSETKVALTPFGLEGTW